MPHSNIVCYEFGPFRLNVGQRILTRAGDPISLTPKATEILVLLLRNAGELVGKEDLMKAVWPDSFVEEANLTQNIFTLRRALGDDRTGARFIETVARRGYRFVAAVKSVEADSSIGEDITEEEDADGKIPLSPILAVLPFVNATGDDGLEYLADGVSENIINSLSQISKLRVMSRSAVFRYKGREVNPRVINRDLGVDAMVLGKIVSPPSGMLINIELVDAATGWQLWGESFECELKDILEIQDKISRQISSALRLKLTGEEEKRITARYTESSRAYQAYIEGRFHWSRYTRAGIEKAIGHFRNAIELDPNYALAYAGIVDCYLRLATNYLPPERDSMSAGDEPEHPPSHSEEKKNDSTPTAESPDPKVKLRHEWDWKGAEREIRRANELRADYPAAHQWHAAYLSVRQLYKKAQIDRKETNSESAESIHQELSARIPSGSLTPTEEVQVLCAIAREQIDVGNYEAACLSLKRWWELGIWPKLIGLSPQSCADLLFTTGELEGFMASAQQLPTGQKNAETLLSGSIALFEQLGSPVRAAEARIELALCYYREGNFDLARSTLVDVLNILSSEDLELRCLALIRLGSLERHAGRLNDALARLQDANSVVKSSGPWVTGRHHLELASTYKDLAVSEAKQAFFARSLDHHREALYEFEAIGNLRLMGIAMNNLGFLHLTLGSSDQAQPLLLRARRMFEELNDKVRRGQVDDTLARLHLLENRFDLAEVAINRAVESLQSGDEDALLAEVLTTKGLVCCKLLRFTEAARILEGAYGVSARCGDREGAGRALLIMIEEMSNHLSAEDLRDIGVRLRRCLIESQQSSIRARMESSLQVIEMIKETTNPKSKS